MHGLADFSGLQAHHDALQRGIGLIQGRFGHVAEISAGRRGIDVLGIIHGERGEIGAAVEAVHQHFYFAADFGFVRGIVVFAIADDGFLAGGYDDLRDAVLRLGDVELLLVRRVEIGNVLIADADFRDDFAVHQFRDGLLAAQIAFQIVHGDAAVFQLAMKFILGEGAFHFGEFVFDFAVARDEI